VFVVFFCCFVCEQNALVDKVVQANAELCTAAEKFINTRFVVIGSFENI